MRCSSPNPGSQSSLGFSDCHLFVNQQGDSSQPQDHERQEGASGPSPTWSGLNAFHFWFFRRLFLQYRKI
jgi:hypothetical protein